MGRHKGSDPPSLADGPQADAIWIYGIQSLECLDACVHLIGSVLPITSPFSDDSSPRLMATRRLSRTPLRVELSRSDLEREALGTTEEHPFWVIGRGWVAAIDLEVGDNILTANAVPSVVVDVAWEGVREDVFNIEVADYHTYFVGRGAAWVHNSCQAGGGGATGGGRHEATYQLRNPDGTFKSKQPTNPIC